MSPVSALPNVEARIAAIQQRIGIRSTTSFSAATSTGLSGSGDMVDFTPTDPTNGFDPFGAAYQSALQTVPVAGSPTAATSTSTTTVDASGIARLQTFGTTDPTSASWVTVAPTDWTSTAATAGAGASVGKIGGYGPMPVPTDLADYGNGQVPAGALESIGQGGHQLYAPAAESWKAAVAAAAADGIDLKVTDSYRTYDQQVELAQRKGLYKNGGYAATPGTSNHGWGLAVDADITAPATLSWLRTNGYKYGFVEAVPREPWHWEFRPQQA